MMIYAASADPCRYILHGKAGPWDPAILSCESKSFERAPPMLARQAVARLIKRGHAATGRSGAASQVLYLRGIRAR
jgi:hypothetical protein